MCRLNTNILSQAVSLLAACQRPLLSSHRCVVVRHSTTKPACAAACHKENIIMRQQRYCMSALNVGHLDPGVFQSPCSYVQTPRCVHDHLSWAYDGAGVSKPAPACTALLFLPTHIEFAPAHGHPSGQKDAQQHQKHILDAHAGRATNTGLGYPDNKHPAPCTAWHSTPGQNCSGPMLCPISAMSLVLALSTEPGDG